MRKRKLFQPWVVLLIGLVALFSCEYEKIIPDIPDPGTPVIYANDIQAIWNKSCTGVGCNGSGQKPQDLTTGNSYNILMNGGYVDTLQPAQSLIYTVMATGGEMVMYTNAKDAGTVLNWIRQGAKDN